MTLFTDDALTPKIWSLPQDGQDESFAGRLYRQRARAIADIGAAEALRAVTLWLTRLDPDFSRLRALSNPLRKLGVEPDANDPAILADRVLAAIPMTASDEAHAHLTQTLTAALELYGAGPLSEDRLARRVKRDSAKARRQANRLNTAHYNLGAVMSAMRVAVGSSQILMTSAYLAGARASRLGLVKHNPFARDPERSEWIAGARIEDVWGHLIEGVDAVTAAPRGLVFEGSRRRPTHYSALLGMANGYDVTIAGLTGRFSTVNVRDLLRLDGHACSSEMVDAIRSKVALDEARAGAPLTDDQEAALSAMTPAFETFLLAAAAAVEREHGRGAMTPDIGPSAGRGTGWGASTVARMRKFGLGFLVDASLNGHFTMRKQGWTVVRRLRDAGHEIRRPEPRSRFTW